MLKKVLTWGLVIFLIFFIASRPDSAAGVARNIGDLIMNLANGIGDFFSSLVR